MFKNFESYVMKHKKLSTYLELAKYLNNKYVESKKFETLPYLTEKWVQNLISQCAPIYEKLKIQKIIQILNKSRNIEARIKME